MLPIPVLPPAVAGVLADTRALAAVQPVPARGPVTAEERAAWLAGLRLVIDAAEAAFTTVLADFDANGDGAGAARRRLDPGVAPRRARDGRW